MSKTFFNFMHMYINEQDLFKIDGVHTNVSKTCQYVARSNLFNLNSMQVIAGQPHGRTITLADITLVTTKNMSIFSGNKQNYSHNPEL